MDDPAPNGLSTHTALEPIEPATSTHIHTRTHNAKFPGVDDNDETDGYYDERHQAACVQICGLSYI